MTRIAEPGNRTTLRSIAEACGVSVPVVSCVINGARSSTRVSEQTRQRILSAAGDYQPNALARTMATGRAWLAGMLFHDPADPTQAYHHLTAFESTYAMSMTLQQAGLVSAQIHLDDVRDPKSPVFSERLLSAIVVVNFLEPDLHATIERMAPVVVWVEPTFTCATNAVYRDETAAARLTAEAIIDHGWRRVIVLSPLLTATPTSPGHPRLEGATSALGAAGVDFSVIHFDKSKEHAALPAAALPDGPDVAVLVLDGYLLDRYLHLALQSGRIPGRDFAIASCDDSAHTTRVWPHLSRASFNRQQLGVDAAELLLAALSSGEPQANRIQTPHWIAGTGAPTLFPAP